MTVEKRKFKFGQIVKAVAFLKRETHKSESGIVMKIWDRKELRRPQTCVVVSAVTLSDGERRHDFEAGYSYKPVNFFHAIKVGLKSGGVRYALIDDVDSDKLPYFGESIT